MPVTLEEIHAPSMLDRMNDAGLTDTFLLKKLKEELKAKKTETIKLKGAVNPANIGKGKTVVATSGIIERDKDGNEYYGDGDTVLSFELIDWGTRQKARQDAHRLRNDYPAEKKEIDLKVKPLVILDE